MFADDMVDYKFVEDIHKILEEAKSAEAAAKSIYKRLCKEAARIGQKPEIEVAIKKPGERRHHPDNSCWCVVWEAGPYQWGIGACSYGPKVWSEPYYSFDMCLYDRND